MTLTMLHEEQNLRKFQILTPELLKIQASWDIMIYRLIWSNVSQDRSIFVSRAKQSQERSDYMTLEMKVSQPYKMSVTMTNLHNIPEDLYLKWSCVTFTTSHNTSSANRRFPIRDRLHPPVTCTLLVHIFFLALFFLKHLWSLCFLYALFATRAAVYKLQKIVLHYYIGEKLVQKFPCWQKLPVSCVHHVRASIELAHWKGPGSCFSN
jgi:hypothetical protein